MSRLPRSLRRKQSNSYRYGCSSGKRGYPSEGAAYLQMIRINETIEAQGDPRRIRNVYRCSECGRWHHTGQISKRSKE